MEAARNLRKPTPWRVSHLIGRARVVFSSVSTATAKQRKCQSRLRDPTYSPVPPAPHLGVLKIGDQCGLPVGFRRQIATKSTIKTEDGPFFAGLLAAFRPFPGPSPPFPRAKRAPFPAAWPRLQALLQPLGEVGLQDLERSQAGD